MRPVTTHPATTRPATTREVTTPPVTTRPVTTRPVTTRPGTNPPATRRRGTRARAALRGAALAVALLACGGEDGAAPSTTNGLPDAPPAGLEPAEWGARLFRDHDCLTCHRVDEGRMVGPGLGGLADRPRPLLEGEPVIADTAYLQRAILRPHAEVVEGYAPTMPSYEGVLSDAQVDALVAYLRTL